MTTEEMTSDECVRAALKSLEQSDEEFVMGNYLRMSERLYIAACHAVNAMAQRRGLPHHNSRETRKAAHRLAKECGDPLVAAGFSTAEKFHYNFIHDSMEDYEIHGERPYARSYIKHVLSLLDDPSAGDGG